MKEGRKEGRKEGGPPVFLKTDNRPKSTTTVFWREEGRKGGRKKKPEN
jgi:hypothetical protein